jgi:hypothetical protein
MFSQRPAVFHTNENKDFLRDICDREAVRVWQQSVVKQKLKYLGLPAAEMLDIVSWEPFLGTFTAIEREENQQHLMFLRANVNDIEHRMRSLYGEFDEILISGRDRYGHSPDWPFDLINLDYFGGLVYSNLARPKAIKKVIENQSNYRHNFLLIITQHLRDGDTIGAKATLLEDIRRSIKNVCVDQNVMRLIDEVMDWFADPRTPDIARQGLYMNVFLRDQGEAEQFDVKCQPAIHYIGTGHSSMIHFVTEFRHRGDAAHRIASEQSLVDVVDFNVRSVNDGTLKNMFRRPQLRPVTFSV